MSNAYQKLEAIRRLILADIEATSDEELRKELIEDGGCPEKIAEEMRVSIETMIQKFQRASGGEACRAEQRGQREWVCDCTQMRPDCKPASALDADAEISRLRDTQRVLVEALRNMTLNFPSEADMVDLGWPTGAVKAACEACDDAHAALASVEKPESVHLASAGGTDATARDALRYRWWRAYVVGDDCSCNDAFIECETAEDFDALTDSAMSTEPKP